MPSPLDSLANARLFFSVVAGTLKIDASTGNQVPETTTIEVRAKLDPAKQGARSQTESLPGVDSNRIYLQGTATDPADLAAHGIHPGAEAEAQWQGKRGRFRLDLTAQPLETVKAILGEKIQGWFEYLGPILPTLVLGTEDGSVLALEDGTVIKL